MPRDLLAQCETRVGALTTADQYDLARAVVEAVRSANECRAKHAALADAVAAREMVTEAVGAQLRQQRKWYWPWQ